MNLGFNYLLMWIILNQFHVDQCYPKTICQKSKIVFIITMRKFNFKVRRRRTICSYLIDVKDS